jgi:Reverse transcriptase (RNA-dependent DNA polymerase)/Resolvase, N terminal domain
MKAAAIYARVSSEQQKEANTIASQTAALVEFAREQEYSVPDEWVIEDEGFSGASLLRPGWSTTTPSRSATRSRCIPKCHPLAANRPPHMPNHGRPIKVTFCVRGVLSPLLANLYMRRLVLGWKKLRLEQSLGSRIVTYADDLVILCKKVNAEAALQRLRAITERLKLTVNEEKTRLCKVPEEEFDFLGYTTEAKDTRRGIPQGSPLSPLLANLYMRRLVLGWKKLRLEQSLGSRIVTYADDLVILCKKGNAEAALQRSRAITERLKLTVTRRRLRAARRAPVDAACQGERRLPMRPCGRAGRVDANPLRQA